MYSWNWRVLALSGALLAPLFGLLTRGVAASPEGDRKAVEAAMQAYAADLQSAPAAKVAAHFAPDGALLLPGMAPLRGPATIRKFLDPMADTITVQSVSVATELLEVHGGTADQWGTYKQTAGEKGKPMQHLQGRYGAFWRHERDGHWRLVRLMMQPTPTPEAGK